MPVFHGLLVIGLALPVENPRAVVDTLKALEPEKLPHFDGEVRIVIDPWASHVVEWLDSDDEGTPIAMGVELLDTDAPIGRLYTQAELDEAVHEARLDMKSNYE